MIAFVAASINLLSVMGEGTMDGIDIIAAYSSAAALVYATDYNKKDLGD